MEKSNMNCWWCETSLIWGGDHDIEEETEEYAIVTNLTCPNCDCYVEVYLPKENVDASKRYH